MVVEIADHSQLLRHLFLVVGRRERRHFQVGCIFAVQGRTSLGGRVDLGWLIFGSAIVAGSGVVVVGVVGWGVVLIGDVFVDAVRVLVDAVSSFSALIVSLYYLL